jgi:UDP-N-acetylglucosamine--N-acetylmuramyl-(pentapeptide) pyrophosphoryl-undecaprenol N-acetylglucosamine transferase
MKKKILITTGGSGGHVLPALTIYDHLKTEYDMLISSDQRGLKYFEIEKYKPIIVDTPKLKISIFFPFTIFKVFLLTIKSLSILKKEKISILISTGGYMSLPLCLAAKLLSIKIYLIEPNMVLGRANKLLLKFSKIIICYSKNIISFPKKFENKLRILKPLVRKKYYEELTNIEEKRLFTITVIGGSQGAKIFDNLLHQSLAKVSKSINIKVIHQTSESNKNFLINFYKENRIEHQVFVFEKDLNKLLIKSDLCITRGGASSLAELSLLKVPFISIPLPSAMDNHQYENAKFYEAQNTCWIINQKDFEKQNFEDLLLNIIKNKEEYLVKKKNLENLNYQNTWINVNQNLLSILNEN